MDTVCESERAYFYRCSFEQSISWYEKSRLICDIDAGEISYQRLDAHEWPTSTIAIKISAEVKEEIKQYLFCDLYERLYHCADDNRPAVECDLHAGWFTAISNSGYPMMKLLYCPWYDEECLGMHEKLFLHIWQKYLGKKKYDKRL